MDATMTPQGVKGIPETTESNDRKREKFGDEFGSESVKRTRHVINDARNSTEQEEGVQQEEEGVTDDIGIHFDEEVFFKFPSFTTAELIEAGKRIFPTLEDSLCTLEKGGYSVYIKNLAEREKEKANSKDDTIEEMQHMMNDARINDDPREYQRTLFEIAKSRNTIVILGTGFGKTLIALLLIRHHGAAFREGKQTLFLVPSVALAIQQSVTIRANLPNYSIQTACYATASTSTAREGLAKANVVVATHGAILDLLQHYGDMFSMTRFNLVILDECHYATGNHAYAMIMNKFYHPLPNNERPRVLGLTASPLVNVKESHTDEQLEAMLTSLETTLDATLASASGLISSEKGLLIKAAEESVVGYVGTNSGRALPAADNLELHESRYREFRRLNKLYQDLGPLIVSIYCRTLKREISRNEFEKETTGQFNEALRLLEHLATFCDQDCLASPNNGRTDKVLALEELLEREIGEHGGAETVGLVFVERRITAMALHNYFLWRDRQVGKAKLPRAKILRQQYVDPCPLVNFGRNGVDEIFDDSADDPFVEFQDLSTSAVMPNGNVNGHDQSMDHRDRDDIFGDVDEPPFSKNEDENRQKMAIRTVVLVRDATQIFNSLCIGRKLFEGEEKKELESSWIHKETKVKEVLANLRRKEVNLLIATSVVEEGVDVQACSFVAVFDTLKNTKGYIQMKGRARQKNAKFFVFHNRTEEQAKSFLHLSSAQDMERRVHQFLNRKSQSKMQSLASHRGSRDENEEAHALPAEIAAVEAGCYEVQNGRVDLHSAKSLVNRYALSVPLDRFSRTSKQSLFAHMPVYEEDRVLLPSHLPNAFRVVTLPEKYRQAPKKEKHRMMSLMAIVRLHSLKVLNDRLLPLSEQDIQSHIFRVGTRGIKHIIPQELPLDKFYGEGEVHAFVYPILQTSETVERYERRLKGKGHRLAIISLDLIPFSIPPFKLQHRELGTIASSLGEMISIKISEEQRSILQEMFVILMDERWRRRTRNMFFAMRQKEEYRSAILPYLVGIQSADGGLDWKLMKLLIWEAARSKEERMTAVRSKSPPSFSEPRLWAPLYDENVPYIVFGAAEENCASPFPAKKEGVKSFQDYFVKCRNFEVAADSLLFDAERLWSLPKNLPICSEGGILDSTRATSKAEPADSDMSEGLAQVKLAQDACLELRLANAHITLLCSMLPQFLYVYERYLNTSAFIEHCFVHLPILHEQLSRMPLDKVAVSLTAISCSLQDSYEILEFFGDAVLKMVQTDALIKSKQLQSWVGFLHEGDLSALRSAMGSNERLGQVCRHFMLHKFIMTGALEKGKWLPSCMTFKESTGSKNDDGLSSKVYADIIEALLGLVFLECGWDVARKVADELNVTVPWSDTDHPQSDFEETSPELRSAISSCTGYNDFKRLELIEEARTHPSALLTEVPSYQRLEWIGDAVLCMAIRTWIYYNIGKGASLERMVEVEAALVSNEVLAFLCVKCGLQHHLNHRDHSLPSRLEDYVWSVRESGDGLWGTDPPKSISDMAEAVIGAIHVDGGFAAGQRACLRFMSPMLDVLLKAQRANKEIRLKHPRKAMQEMAGELLEVNLERGPYFASTSPDIDVLVQGGKWGRTSKDGNSFVGSVGILGSILTGVSDTSEKVARNKVCALAVCTIETNPELCDRLKTCLRRLESAHSHNENALAQKRLLEASAAPRIELESEYHAIV